MLAVRVQGGLGNQIFQYLFALELKERFPEADVAIDLNEQSAKLYASQGQRRSLALAMKLAEGAISRSVGGEEPVYLLDDVFSELDGERREYLLSALGERQVIITSCEGETMFSHIPDMALHAVSGGEVQRVR